jgi:nicotinamidase-related amidase
MSSVPRRALIVIDVQNDFVNGSLSIEYPNVQLSLGNIGKAMDAARAAGIPVVVVQTLLPVGAPMMAVGTAGAELHDVVSHRPRDHFLEKRLPSALADTDLRVWLTQRAVDTLVVVGYLTHNCVDATIRHAVHAGFSVEFLSDAAGAIAYANRAGSATAEEIHRAYTVVLQSRFAAVMTTDEWVGALQTGISPERDNIFASNQRARGLHQSATT